jgi:hypothetical protein
MVKGAFDCYLPELAEKLGYELPKDEKGRYTFWEEVSRRANYNRTFDTKWTPSEPLAIAISRPLEGGTPTKPPDSGSG